MMKKIEFILVVGLCLSIIAGCSSPTLKEECKVNTYISCIAMGGDVEQVSGLEEYYDNGRLLHQKRKNATYIFYEDDIDKEKNIVIDDISVSGTYVRSGYCHGVNHILYEEELDDCYIRIQISKTDGSLFRYSCSFKTNFYPSEEQLKNIYSFEDCYKIASGYANKYCSYRDDMVLELVDSKIKKMHFDFDYYEYCFYFELKYNDITVSEVDVFVDNFGTFIQFNYLDKVDAEFFVKKIKELDLNKYHKLINEELRKVITCSAVPLQYELVSQSFCCYDVLDGLDSAYIICRFKLFDEDASFNSLSLYLNIEVPISMIQ